MLLALVGQLFALTFAFRLAPSGQPTSAQGLPRVTGIYLALFAVVGLLSACGVLPAEQLAFDSVAISEERQWWRAATAFVWCDGIGAEFALQLWFFGMYSSLLERGRYASSGALMYAGVLCAGAMHILAFAAVIGTAPSVVSLCNAFVLFVAALWSRDEPARAVSFLQVVTVRAAFVPWCLLVCFVPLTGAAALVPNLCGIGSGVAFDLASRRFAHLAGRPSSSPPPPKRPRADSGTATATGAGAGGAAAAATAGAGGGGGAASAAASPATSPAARRPSLGAKGKAAPKGGLWEKRRDATADEAPRVAPK